MRAKHVSPELHGNPSSSKPEFIGIHPPWIASARFLAFDLTGTVFAETDLKRAAMNSPCRQMHRVFLIQELLALICEHVRNDQNDSDVGRRTLAALALTSKVFHHVATSTLWSNLTGLAPLLKTLASDVTFSGQFNSVSSSFCM